MKSTEGAVDALTPTEAANSDTLVSETIDAQTSPSARVTAPRLQLPGYEVGHTLGKGGMGEVLLGHDRKIGRSVAIKRMRDVHNGEAMERFLREAKIQARLDHPAIVPVHELGTDASGAPYFTMKRLAGRTLHEVLDQAPQQQMLRAFVDVCLAVDFAHARGVVHRDLKPSNIMLGDYGEVYVLDWGIARVLAEREVASGDVEPVVRGDITTLESHTQIGALLGTPGYMSPEQVRGDEVGRASDIYALGSILFEILTGEPLHPRGTAALATTVSHPCESPAARKPDRAIAPELDAATTLALAEDPSARPSARELGELVQRYLDGDRDHERRRELAADFLARARNLAGDSAQRAETMRLAGRALALDPESPEAAELVMRLMIEPPTKLPAELETHLADVENRLASRTAYAATYAMLAYFLFIPLVIWNGVRNWPLVFAVYGVVGVISWVTWRQARTGRSYVYVALLFNAVLMVMFSRVLSPFIFVPGIIGAITAGLVAQPGLIERPWVVIGISLAAFLVPLGLEAVGLFDSTWDFVGDKLVIRSPALHIGGVATAVLLIVSNVAVIVVNGMFGGAMSDTRKYAQRQLEIQAWQLRKLLPIEPPHPEVPVPSCPISCPIPHSHRGSA